MKREEAIKDLDIIRFNPHWDELVNEEYWKELMEMAITALQNQSVWIPVSERLPEESLNSVIGWDTYRNRCCFVQYLGGRFVLGYDIDGVNVTAWMPLPESYSTDAEKPHIEKPQTNADRIRSMTDEELAEFLPIASNFICQPTEECIRNTVMNHCGECERTEECAMKWLRAESEG